MPEGRSRRLRDLVEAAARLPVEQRFAHLRRACGDDRALYREALAALGTELSKPEWWQDAPAKPSPPRAATPPHSRQTSPSTPGSIIGDYVVTESVGQGGMSDVVKAMSRTQRSARPVAIKLIRNAIATPQLHSRLKSERQILAALDHPNIARFLDGGSTPDGQPYIVMEYIDGEQIDRYCERQHLPVPERLKLFATVCRAVHHAHERQVLHRDLKPSNIIVTPEGEPKLLDFGIAKLLDQRRVDHTIVVTQLGFRMLTPDHASPEQMRGDALTPSSDVYVLGVLLYELLVSRLPYAKEGPYPPNLHRAVCLLPPVTLIETVRMAEHGEGTLSLEALSKERSTNAPELKDMLCGELNEIVLTALAKEPEQRYASAAHFAERIDTYLASRTSTSAVKQRLWPWIVFPMLAAVALFALVVWMSRL